MSTLEELVRGAREDPLSAAREAARAGQAVVGYVGVDVPVELLVAAGAFPLRLPAPVGVATPAADAYLEPGFLREHRAMAELWLGGALDFVDTVVFSRGSDSAQRLYYYLCELQRTGRCRGPQPLLYDIAKIPRDSSRAHAVDSTRRLAAALGCREQSLAQAVAAADSHRASFARLAALRATERAPPGEACADLLLAEGVLPWARFDAALAQWLAGDWRDWRGPRVLLAGSAPPDPRLHAAIDRAGGRVVAEHGDFRPDDGRLGHASDLLDAIGRRAHELPAGPRSFHDVAEGMLRHVVECRADGVVLWITEEDESWTWEVPAIQAALAARSLPLLVLPRSRWDGADDATSRAAQFIESLEVGR